MKQLNSDRPKAMDKETFMQQYVLNRALTSDNLSGVRCTEEAELAWRMIEKFIKSDGGSDEND